MKEKWFQYVVENKAIWCPKFTLKRLEKVKNSVLGDKDIMFDLLLRHGGDKKTPQEMSATDPITFRHCIDNFVCNILYKMMDERLINNS